MPANPQRSVPSRTSSCTTVRRASANGAKAKEVAPTIVHDPISVRIARACAVGGYLADQPGLARAGLTADERGDGLACLHLREELVEQPQLCRPTHELRARAPGLHQRQYRPGRSVAAMVEPARPSFLPPLVSSAIVRPGSPAAVPPRPRRGGIQAGSPCSSLQHVLVEQHAR